MSYDTLSETTKQIMPGWCLDLIQSGHLRILYLTSSRSGSPQIYRFQLDSKLLERITFQGDGNQAPSIGKDGSTMTYVRRIKDEYQLIVHHPKKGTKHQKLLSSLYTGHKSLMMAHGYYFLNDKGAEISLGSLLGKPTFA